MPPVDNPGRDGERMTTTETLLVRLTVPADDTLVVPVRDFVNRVLARFGFAEEQLLRFDLIVEEACLHVMQNAFDTGETGMIDVSVERRPNQIAIVLEDRGLPGDLADAARGDAPLGLVLMRAFADEVVFSNLGKRGRRLEVIKDIAGSAISAQVDRDEDRPAGAAPVATDAVVLRLMTADDAMPLARCIYRSYGYTYGNEFVYFPDRVAELLAGGRLVSCVAENEAGEVVGHLGLQFAAAGDRVAESGVAVVDPRYRGRKLFERMKTHMAEWAGANGVYGLFSEAVAVHPITQKGNLNLGASETGVLLGYLPVGLEFRNIKDAAEARRQSAILFYMKTNQEPEREVYPPPHHREMLRRIYDKIPLRRNGLQPAGPSPAAEIPALGRLSLHVKADTGRAFLRVDAYGADTAEQVHAHLRELCLRKIDCIFLDLPLAAPPTAVLCAAFERMGFSFAGVGVETVGNGDTLRLLYLNNVEIDTTGLVVVSEHGQALAAYVLAARREAERPRLPVAEAAGAEA